MRPETGNKPSTSLRKVSIQQPLDGHSFSIPEGTGPSADGSPVEVELLTAHTMLVPEALHAPERAEAWFAADGMPVAEDECVVASDPRSGCVALIAVKRTLVELLREKWGANIRFTTPLLHVPPEEERCVWICRAGGAAYIKLYDKALAFADVLPADDEEDLLYFIDRLAACYSLHEYSLRLAGDGAKSVRRLLGKRFKRVICE